MRKIGVGFIGVGFMGEGHVRFMRDSPYARLVGVADIDAGRAERVARENGVPTWYADYRQLLRNPEVEAVVVATPDHLHRDPAVAAAEAGKHILQEKPLASTLEDADAICSSVRRAGVRTMMGFVYRFYPQLRAVKEFAESGRLGEALVGHVRMDGDINEAKRAASRTIVQLWVGVHAIDLLLWCVLDEVKRVYAEAVEGHVKAEFGKADYSLMLLKFGKGAVGYIQCGWAMPSNWNDWQYPRAWAQYYGNMTPHSFQLVGTKGVIETRLPPEGVFAADEESRGVKLPSFMIAEAYRWQDDHFLRCLAGDRKPEPEVFEGRRSVEVALAAEKSQLTGTPVPLPL